MIFGIAAVLILLMIFSGVAVPLAFLGGSFFVAYMGLGSTGTFATNAFYILNSISMLAIPLFIVGGSLIERSGIANVLIRVADKMLHNVKGGLTATIPVVSCFFGALCGSALATANTLSTAMVPELEKKGYDKAYLAALIAASSPFGFMIPPNVNAIIFASVSSASVGALFMATIVPGLIWAGLYLIVNAPYQVPYKLKAASAALLHCFFSFLTTSGNFFDHGSRSSKNDRSLSSMRLGISVRRCSKYSYGFRLFAFAVSAML